MVTKPWYENAENVLNLLNWMLSDEYSTHVPHREIRALDVLKNPGGWEGIWVAYQASLRAAERTEPSLSESIRKDPYICVSKIIEMAERVEALEAKIERMVSNG